MGHIVDIENAPIQLGQLERHLLNDYQHNFPLSPTPFADIAAQLGSTEQDVLEGLKALQASGAVSRVGAVFRTHRVGASTLAAMAVPPEQLDEVADLVSGYEEVNHNSEREHRYNLWFVATARNDQHLGAVLEEIEMRTGIAVMALPMLDDYHIDLGFDLRWK